jgi:exopolysaccharide biosynthesis polyprenyl glycosylphosphotransferase
MSTKSSPLPVRVENPENESSSDELSHGGVIRSTGAEEILRRALDVTVSGLLLLFLLPLYLMIAVAIRLSSPGPVLFIQPRVGQHGHEFPFLKFRSMYADAEVQRRALEAMNERTGPVFKMRNDPRVTPIGRVLRKYSLDELPQLLNVWRGEMSLVGPRPALPREVAQYLPSQRQRLIVRPGLTGLWQVSGRANLSFEEAIHMDLTYIRQRSLWLDIVILARTVPAVLSADGAY